MHLRDLILIGLIIAVIIEGVALMGMWQNLTNMPNGWAGLNANGKLIYPLPKNSTNDVYFESSRTGAIPAVGNGCGGLYIKNVPAYLDKWQVYMRIRDDTGTIKTLVGIDESTNGVSLYSTNGFYFLKRDTSNNIYLMDYDTSEYMIRIQRVGANNYALAVNQGNSWVTK